MIFFLCSGDLSRRNTVLDTPYNICLEYFYLRKVEELNEAISNLPEDK